MGQFYITNSKAFDDAAERVVHKTGFSKGHRVSKDGIILNIFKKKMIDNVNFFSDGNGDFVGVNGTLIYRECMGEQSLKRLLHDFDGNDLKSVEKIRENSIGHYVIIIMKGGTVYLFCDKYNLYDVFYYQEGEKFIVSNSYFGIVESMSDRKLNHFALFEEVLTVACVGRENVFEGMYKLMGYELLVINPASAGNGKNPMLVKSLGYSRKPRRFYKSFDSALDECEKKAKYLFTVIDRNFKNIGINLTGGLDTRAVLAGLNYADADYHVMFGVAPYSIIETQKEDLECVVLFAQKYAKQIHLMDWNFPPGPYKMSDDLFYKMVREVNRCTPKFLAEVEGKIPRYPYLFVDGLFGETFKARSWLEFQLFRKRTSFRKLIKKYHLTDDKCGMFKDDDILEKYVQFIVDNIKGLSIDDLKIPMDKGKIGLDHFNEVRQLFSRAMDNHYLNFYNQYSYALSPLGDLMLYEICLNLPFSFRKDNRFEIELVKRLDASTLDVPLFTHMELRKLDKDKKLVEEDFSYRKFRSFISYNFLGPARLALNVANRLRGKRHRHEEHLKKYRAFLKDDPVFSKYFKIDKIESIWVVDAMFLYSLILKRYYYGKNKKK